ncbi:MAG: hypothetical protein A4E70_01378 [Syntrophus sp. PtaU1.Bin005]|nr:MAG: hypothetical protein A4E70_01378 [Syntrophus sp. PtaU1.Bin005]
MDVLAPNLPAAPAVLFLRTPVPEQNVVIHVQNHDQVLGQVKQFRLLPEGIRLLLQNIRGSRIDGRSGQFLIKEFLIQHIIFDDFFLAHPFVRPHRSTPPSRKKFFVICSVCMNGNRKNAIMIFFHRSSDFTNCRFIFFVQGTY